MIDSDLLNRYLTMDVSIAEKRRLVQMLSYPDLWDLSFEKIWDQSNGDVPETVNERVRNKIDMQINSLRRMPWLRFWSIAASIVAVVMSGVSFLVWNNQHGRAKYADTVVEVGRGQRSDITLPDGTRVNLNSGSKLIYGQLFDQRQRLVKLEGEAFFEVAKDEKSPFKVDLGSLMVEATGTSFNITSHQSDKRSTIYLSSGSVTVNSSSGPTFLYPSEVMVFDHLTGVIAKESGVDKELYIGWKNNQVVLENKSLEQVLSQLERNFNVRFTILDQEVKYNRYSGTLQTNSLQNILELMTLTSNIRYRIKDGEIGIYSNNPKIHKPMK